MNDEIKIENLEAIMREGFEEIKQDRLKAQQFYQSNNSGIQITKSKITIAGLLIAILTLGGGWLSGYSGSIAADTEQKLKLESACEDISILQNEVLTKEDFKNWTIEINSKLDIEVYNTGVEKDNYNFRIIEDHMQLPLIEKKEVNNGN